MNWKLLLSGALIWAVLIWLGMIALGTAFGAVVWP